MSRAGSYWNYGETVASLAYYGRWGPANGKGISGELVIELLAFIEVHAAVSGAGMLSAKQTLGDPFFKVCVF
jgi:hypothetical protein